MLDINSNPDNTVIGDRSPGSTAGLVSRMGAATMRGSSEARVLSVIITELLRKEMGFDRLVFTDDLTMGAGADVILIAHGYDLATVEASSALVAAARSGEISRERLEQSAYRILRVKRAYGLNGAPVGTANANDINKGLRQVLELLE